MRRTLRLPLIVSLVLHLAIGTFGVRAVRLATPPAAASPSGTMTGETFDLHEEEPGDLPGDPASPTQDNLAPQDDPSTSAASAGKGGTDGIEPAPPPRPSSRSRRTRGQPGQHALAASAGAGGSEPPPPPAPYGAAGERGAVDLATAFTRGFPQAASMDARWIQAPFGSAGEAVVVLDIAPNGTLIDHRVSGSPSAALRVGIERTVALIGAREFTATGAVTRLKLTASVSPDQVHDGLHGDVFAIGGSFAQAEGNAFFALAIGRRIDIRVRALP